MVSPDKVLYHNDVMKCEGLFGMCPRAVLRAYQPFCPECFKRGISRGVLESRNGKRYRYNGRRWVLDWVVDQEVKVDSGPAGPSVCDGPSS